MEPIIWSTVRLEKNNKKQTYFIAFDQPITSRIIIIISITVVVHVIIIIAIVIDDDVIIIVVVVDVLN